MRVGDGVAVAERGDLFMCVWREPANCERARFVFDYADRMVERQEGGILALILVMPSSSPPDYATAMELISRQARIRRKVRRQSHVALGGKTGLGSSEARFRRCSFV